MQHATGRVERPGESQEASDGKKRVERPGESQEASDGKKSKSLALKWCAQPIQKAR